MGFEVPAAIGVQFARPHDTVWAFCGDGGFQMTMQELALCTEYELPIKFAIINNNYLGMVRQWQDTFYAGNKQSVRMFQPDFVKLAEAMGITGIRVSDKSMVESSIEAALRHPGAVLIDFQVEERRGLLPDDAAGVSLSDTIDQPPVEAAGDGAMSDDDCTRSSRWCENRPGVLNKIASKWRQRALQHREPHRRPQRGAGAVAHDVHRRRRGARHRAGDEAALQGHRGREDHRRHGGGASSRASWR